MKAFILLLIISILSAISLVIPTLAAEVSGNSLTLSEEEAEICRLGGGCVVVPIKPLREYLKSCGNRL